MNAVVVAVFEWAKSDGVSVTTRDSSNAAIGRGRNIALTEDVLTPSQNGATFKSDGVSVTTRDSRNAAIGRGRNGALTVVVVTPSQNCRSDIHKRAWQSRSSSRGCH